MKKAFKFMAIAAIAFGMSMTVACTDDSENSGNGNGNGGNTENLPTTIDENFDNGMPSGWTCIDADGDGNNWVICSQSWFGQNGFDNQGVNGTDCMMSASYINNIGALYPDNYLVSPKIKITEGATLTYQVGATDANYYEEHYAVLVGTIENGAFNKVASLLDEIVPSADFTTRTVDLSAYAGQNLCIAFRHFDITDMYWMAIDNVQVQ